MEFALGSATNAVEDGVTARVAASVEAELGDSTRRTYSGAAAYTEA